MFHHCPHYANGSMAYLSFRRHQNDTFNENSNINVCLNENQELQNGIKSPEIFSIQLLKIIATSKKAGELPQEASRQQRLQRRRQKRLIEVGGTSTGGFTTTVTATTKAAY